MRSILLFDELKNFKNYIIKVSYQPSLLVQL